MRFFIVLAFLFNTAISIGQSLENQQSRIDSLVTVIESGTRQSPHTFSILSTQGKGPRIKYQYWLKNGHVTKIVRAFKIANDSTVQTFYFTNNQLLYSTEYITTYDFPNSTEALSSWGGSYYFSKHKLIHFVTLGHGKSETEGWNPEHEVLSNCKVAKIDIKRNATKKGGG